MRHAVVFPDQATWRPAAGRRFKTDPSWRMVEQAEAVLKRPVADGLLSEDAPEAPDVLAVSVLLTSLMNWKRCAATLAILWRMQVIHLARSRRWSQRERSNSQTQSNWLHSAPGTLTMRPG